MIKINIYEGALKLSKAKLYKSPYKESIDEVWKVLKNFKPKNQLNFLRNLRNLEIKLASHEELKNFNYDTLALYDSAINKIYLTNNDSLDSLKSNLNHELFHMASRGKNALSGISFPNSFDNPGKNLNEGITEYLNLKSRNAKTSNSGYQMELFVIEILIDIFGEQILEPYFNNDPKTFYNQFLEHGVSVDMILDLDKFMKRISKNYNINNYRLVCLGISDMFSEYFKEDISFFKNLKLDFNSYGMIIDILSKYQLILKDKFDVEINLFEYQFKDINKKELFDEYIIDYQNTQRDIFSKILDLLIEIAKIKNISSNDISNFIQESLLYKHDDFKKIYTSTINEKLELSNKKR